MTISKKFSKLNVENPNVIEDEECVEGPVETITEEEVRTDL